MKRFVRSPSTETRECREFASEIKFLVNPAFAEQIRVWARARLLPDPYAGGEAGDGYQITSLYFDTQQFDVFHRRGSFGRSKYRIRRYDESQVVFLERKLKTRALLTKRRSIVRLEELECLSGEDAERAWAGYWFHQRLLARRLNPVCQISYRRTARVAMTPYGPIRLTLDENLRALPVAGLWFSEQEGTPLMKSSTYTQVAYQGHESAISRSADSFVREFPRASSRGHGCPRSEVQPLKDQVILEMKFRCGMPSIFKYLVEEFALTPKPISKYRLAIAALGLVDLPASATQEDCNPQYA